MDLTWQDYILGFGPLPLSWAVVSAFVLWVAWDERQARRTAVVIVFATGTAFISLSLGLSLYSSYFWDARMTWVSDATLDFYRSQTLLWGRLLYVSSLGLGLAAAVAASRVLGAPLRQSLLVTTGIMAAFFITPVFIWTEFFTASYAGDAILLRGAAWG
jgi:hypothetical protein